MDVHFNQIIDRMRGRFEQVIPVSYNLYMKMMTTYELMTWFNSRLSTCNNIHMCDPNSLATVFGDDAVAVYNELDNDQVIDFWIDFLELVKIVRNSR